MKRWALALALASAASARADVERPHLWASVHLFPFTSFPDLLGAQVTFHGVPYLDVTAGLSAFPGRFGWWARGGPRFVVADFRDDAHRGATWRVSALAGWRSFRDAKADAGGFSAALSTDVTHFFSPHLGLSIQAACGGLYDAPARRLLPELRLGVGLTF